MIVVLMEGGLRESKTISEGLSIRALLTKVNMHPGNLLPVWNRRTNGIRELLLALWNNTIAWGMRLLPSLHPEFLTVRPLTDPEVHGPCLLFIF